MSTTVNIVVKDASESSSPNVIQKSEVEKYVTGSANPLHDISLPVKTTVVQDNILLQAQDIKETLERIFRQDPTARSHTFPYAIFKPNAELLQSNGFTLRTYGNPIMTEVSWVTERQFIYTLPETA